MVYIFDNFELNTIDFTLYRANQYVNIEPQALRLVIHLITNRSRIVSKEELIEVLWPDQVISRATLCHSIMTARRTLGDNGRRQRIIRTIHGHGYRFIAKVKSQERSSLAIIQATKNGALGQPQFAF